jgi:hypothetical protein
MSGHHPAVPPRHPQGIEAVDTGDDDGRCDLSLDDNGGRCDLSLDLSPSGLNYPIICFDHFL